LYATAGRYEQFLEGTLAESFLYILEPTITIYSRKSDVDIVKQAATTASRTYKEISGRDISLDVQGAISDEAYVSIQLSMLGLAKANLLRHACLGAKEA
jgi:V-type H+-transporting ATPase subunit E